MVESEAVEPHPSPEQVLSKVERRLRLLKLIDRELTGFQRELALDDLANDFPPGEAQALKFGKTSNNIKQVRHQYRSKLQTATEKHGWTWETF